MKSWGQCMAEPSREQGCCFWKIMESSSEWGNILQRNQADGRRREMCKNRGILGIGSCNYRDWEVPLSVVCMVETQECCWWAYCELEGLQRRRADVWGWEKTGLFTQADTLILPPTNPLCLVFISPVFSPHPFLIFPLSSPFLSLSLSLLSLFLWLFKGFLLSYHHHWKAFLLKDQFCLCGSSPTRC